MPRPSETLLLALMLLPACGGADSAALFSASSAGSGGTGGGTAPPGPGGSGGSVAPGSGGTLPGGSGGTLPGGSGGTLPGGSGGALPGGSGGTTGSGGEVPDAAAGGAPEGGTGGKGATADSGAGGQNGSGGTSAAPPLPTGTKGFPTNPPDCPKEVPKDGSSCSGALGCQYPDLFCGCGLLDGSWSCNAQANQCLVQEHCATGLCHPVHHVCTPCVVSGDCHDAQRPLCHPDGNCVQCLSDANCSGFTPYCGFLPFSPTQNTCVQCIQDSDCSSQQVCQSFFGYCG